MDIVAVSAWVLAPPVFFQIITDESYALIDEHVRIVIAPTGVVLHGPDIILVVALVVLVSLQQSG